MTLPSQFIKNRHLYYYYATGGYITMPYESNHDNVNFNDSDFSESESWSVRNFMVIVLKMVIS